MPEEKKKKNHVLNKDPRFVRRKTTDTKLVVDKRFTAMFKDKEFKKPVKVDKLGRKVKKDNDLEKYYKLEEEESKDTIMSDGSLSDSNSADSTLSDSFSSDEDLVMEEMLESHPLVAGDVPVGDATRRLAIVNMDWDQIKAIDLFHLVNAFKPTTGIVHSVKIYPSEFGKERMAQEAVSGPPKDLFGQDDGDEDYNEKQLRKYQLERLRYYYAIVECDSVETAAVVYKNCDGSEFEKSANFLDLRFVPDSESFKEDEVHDSVTADEAGKKTYKGKIDLETAALQHSKVKLTWDQDDPDRERITRASIKGDFDFNENDLRAYLASSSSEDDDQDKVQKYRSLLSEDNPNVFGRKSRDTQTEDLQVTFDSALARNDSDLDMEATFSLETKKEPETVFEKYLEKRKAKRKARKEKIQHSESENSSEDVETKAKLDLFVPKSTKDFSLDSLLKAKSNDNFEINVDDPRFSAIYDSSSFAIDPSNPSFKPTTGMKKIIQERQKRLKQ